MNVAYECVIKYLVIMKIKIFFHFLFQLRAGPNIMLCYVRSSDRLSIHYTLNV